MIRVLHWGLMGTLLGEALYCWYQVMVVLQPEGVAGPMFGHAASLPFELLASRRLYAIEGWLAFVGWAVYLGITEVRPRLHPPG